MLRDNREYDFSALSERISAQTEAYVEFSNALVKIIEQTASIRDRITENNSHLVEEYRDLNSKFQQLLIDFNKFLAENNNAETNLNKNIDYLSNKFKSFETQLDEMIKETESKNACFFKIFNELGANNSNTNKLIEDNHKNLTQDVDAIHKIVLSTETKLENIFKNIKIALGIIGFISLLMGLGVISINWFKN